ncbi:MAG TPA: ABC transporter ATP-binding protein [Candidatus Nanoarchaeia archaeon]|nr:ABC transporter ATP-binding protein [Candidatus Nanoarchaeia archaeon]
MPSEIIKLKNVCKYYKRGENKVKAVDGISLSVNEGDFIVIKGPSGSGKSTLMNLVGNLDTPSCGKLYLDNKDTSTLTESELSQIRGRKIGFIFQQFNLIPSLTAKENIMLPMIFQGIDRYERHKKADELLKLVQLEDRGEHYPNQLSGGQQQRVAIARSLSNDPEVILADEPTGNLDTKTGDTVLHFLERLNKKGKTIVMVTHEEDIGEYANIIHWIVDGKISKTKRKKNNKKETKKKTDKK